MTRKSQSSRKSLDEPEQTPSPGCESFTEDDWECVLAVQYEQPVTWPEDLDYADHEHLHTNLAVSSK